MPTTQYLIRRAGLTAHTDWEPYPYEPTPFVVADMAAQGYELAIVTWAGVVTNVTVENPWTLANDTAIRLNLDASNAASITASGNAATAWADPARNRTLTGAATTGVLTLNGRNALDLGVANGGFQLLGFNGGFPSATDAMTVAVIRKPANSSRYGVYMAQDGSSRVLLQSQGAGYQYSHNDAFQFVGSAAGNDGDWHVVVGFRQGTTLGVSVDGVVVSNTQGANIGGINRIYISGDQAGEAVAQVVLTDAYSVDLRQRYEGFMAHRWGQIGKLGSGHPYKTAAPTVLETA